MYTFEEIAEAAFNNEFEKIAQEQSSGRLPAGKIDTTSVDNAGKTPATSNILPNTSGAAQSSNQPNTGGSATPSTLGRRNMRSIQEQTNENQVASTFLSRK